MKMKFGKVDYNSKTPPKQYKCTDCGAYGCKLWREYQTFLDHQTLSCCDCAAKSQKKDISTIDDDGKYLSGFYKTDSIGWRVPAIPTEDGKTFWGYCSVPSNGINWWKNLPTRIT